MAILRAGLSGAGPIGAAAIAATRAHRHCDFIAVHDDDPAAAARLATASGLGTATSSFAELLATGVDFVVLTGPVGARLAQVEEAVDQGVPCLLHGPFAPDLATAGRMAAAAARAEVRIGVVVPGQEDPLLDQLRCMIAADWLGGVVAVQALYGDDQLLRQGAPAPPDDVFFALAGQHLQLATWLTGRRPRRVTAQTTRSFAPPADDGGAATALLRGNVLCSLQVSRLTRASLLAIHGTDGGAQLTADRIWLTGHRPFDGPAFPYPTPGRELVLARHELAGALAPLRRETELHGRFARWLDDTDDFPCPIEEAVVTAAALDALRRAAASGTAVDL